MPREVAQALGVAVPGAFLDPFTPWALAVPHHVPRPGTMGDFSVPTIQQHQKPFW